MGANLNLSKGNESRPLSLECHLGIYLSPSLLNLGMSVSLYLSNRGISEEDHFLLFTKNANVSISFFNL